MSDVPSLTQPTCIVRVVSALLLVCMTGTANAQEVDAGVSSQTVYLGQAFQYQVSLSDIRNGEPETARAGRVQG